VHEGDLLGCARKYPRLKWMSITYPHLVDVLQHWILVALDAVTGVVTEELINRGADVAHLHWVL
jgi:hypothetical protein